MWCGWRRFAGVGCRCRPAHLDSHSMRVSDRSQAGSDCLNTCDISQNARLVSIISLMFVHSLSWQTIGLHLASVKNNEVRTGMFSHRGCRRFQCTLAACTGTSPTHHHTLPPPRTETAAWLSLCRARRCARLGIRRLPAPFKVSKTYVCFEVQLLIFESRSIFACAMKCLRGIIGNI